MSNIVLFCSLCTFIIASNFWYGVGENAETTKDTLKCFIKIDLQSKHFLLLLSGYYLLLIHKMVCQLAFMGYKKRSDVIVFAKKVFCPLYEKLSMMELFYENSGF